MPQDCNGIIVYQLDLIGRLGLTTKRANNYINQDDKVEC